MWATIFSAPAFCVAAPQTLLPAAQHLVALPPSGSNNSTATVLLTPRLHRIALDPSDLLSSDIAKLKQHSIVIRAKHEHLVILVRNRGDSPELSGSLSGSFEGLGNQPHDTWGITFSIENLDRMILDLAVTAKHRFIGYTQFRGAAVRAVPTGPLLSGWTERRKFTGKQSGLTRTIAIYHPNSRLGSPNRILYVLDIAELPESFFHRVDQLISEGVIRPILVVGLPAGTGVDSRESSDVRLEERVSGLNVDVYRKYRQFVFDDLLPSLSRELRAGSDPERVAIVGSSASATWALNEAVSHGSVARTWGAFGLPAHVINQLPAASDQHIYMGGGTLDLVYLTNSLTKCAEILQKGGNCRFSTVNSGHSQGAWDELTADLLIDWDRRKAE